MDQREAMTVAAEFQFQSRKLYGERVMLICDEAQTTVGTVVELQLPGDAKLRKQSGVIVMVGVDVDRDKYDVKIGDRVLFTRYQPVEGELERLDGSTVMVAMMHVSDLYVGTDDPDLRDLFEKECERLMPLPF